ncbi:MAG: carboxypeptidase regulatory-like domain-containing protein [Acidobacteriaceae bacterium]|nr:carboxypeptidase regulatory-like domain-containing protein [Acidobacteriaceae bacterium]
MVALLPVAALLTASSMLDGTVTDSASGEALRKATVRLSPADNGARGYIATSDESGRFHFENIPGGDYTLEGERAGYLCTQMGTRHQYAEGITLHLRAGDKLSNVNLKLVRRGVIGGRVLDEMREPVPRIPVQAFSPSCLAGRNALCETSMGTTNSAGEYRMTDLAPGRYYVYASDPPPEFVDEQGGRQKRLHSVFFPNSERLANATPIQIDAGQELQGIDLELPVGYVYHIKGKVQSRGDLVLNDIRANLVRSDTPSVFLASSIDIERNGTFDISGVAPGEYSLEIEDRRGTTRTSTAVTVKNKDVTALFVSLPEPLTLTGIVHWAEGQSGELPELEIAAYEPAGGASEIATVEDGGTFRIENLYPGRYVLSIDPSGSNVYATSILYAGQEVKDSPLDLRSGVGRVEILIRKGAGQISGSVQLEDKQSGMLGAVTDVVLIPEGESWDGRALRIAQTDQNGRFVFNGVAPGKYHVLAASDVEDYLWRTREFYVQVQGSAVSLEVSENGTTQLTVPVLAAAEIERARNSL